MSGLLSLPNDTLIDVYRACPTVQTAVRLSAVNKLLRSVWLDNNNANHIVKAIVTATTPAAAQAISYAMMETRLRTFAIAAYVARRKSLLERCIRPMLIAVEIPSPESYYLVRRCVLAYEFPELRDALYEEVSNTSRDRLAEACELQHFLSRQSDMEETIRQGALFRKRFFRPLSEDFSEDDLELHEDGWNYANDVLGTADWIQAQPNDAHKLLAAIQGYVVNNMDNPEMPQPWPDFSQVRLLAEAKKRDDEQPWRRNL